MLGGGAVSQLQQPGPPLESRFLRGSETRGREAGVEGGSSGTVARAHRISDASPHGWKCARACGCSTVRAPPAGPPAPRPGVRVRQHHQGSDFRGASGFPGQRQPALHRPHGLPLTPAAPSRCLPPATFAAQCLVSCGAQPPV